MAGFDRPLSVVADEIPRTRRFAERARVSWTVWARLGQQRMRFHTVDVSSRGAKLRPRGPFGVGSAVQMEFMTPDGRQLPVSGVLWRADADGVAVMFLGTVPRGSPHSGTGSETRQSGLDMPSRERYSSRWPIAHDHRGRHVKEAFMFSYVKQVGIPTALAQEAPAFLASFVIAEVFYKFHSFTLECAAFLVTWYGLSWVQSLIVGPRAK